MSFADELRNAPAERERAEEQKRQEELNQQKSDWLSVVNEWYKYIKEDCKKAAEDGRTSRTVSFESFVQNLDEVYGPAPGWFVRVDSRIRASLNPLHPEMLQICLTKEDAEDIETIIRKRFELEGLSTEFQKKEYKKYKYERVFVKRSDGERAAASILNSILPSNTFGLKEDEGSYKNKTKLEGYRYGLSVTVSW